MTLLHPRMHLTPNQVRESAKVLFHKKMIIIQKIVNKKKWKWCDICYHCTSGVCIYGTTDKKTRTELEITNGEIKSNNCV